MKSPKIKAAIKYLQNDLGIKKLPKIYFGNENLNTASFYSKSFYIVLHCNPENTDVIISLLGHEFKHVQQYLENKLFAGEINKKKYFITWENKYSQIIDGLDLKDPNYKNFPWEKEAYSYQRNFVLKFNRYWREKKSVDSYMVVA